MKGTGLSVIRVSDSEGFRLYYKDDVKRTLYLRFNDDDWEDGGFISQDTSTEATMNTAYYDEKYCVLTPRDDDTAVEVMRWAGPGEGWEISQSIHKVPI